MTARFDPNRITFFAKTDARGRHVPFGIKAIDRTKHMYVIGKTGMGKSTLLENMAVQDIRNGEGLAFIDPHGASAETLLDYIPEERKDDVLYFAPFDMEHPISFNVMEDVGADKRHLVVSGLMSVFEKIWVDAWSARMAYILQNTLMALLEYPDSTLLGVNRMLSDKNYRRKVVENISDPSVKSFWVDEFAKYNERYMQEAGDAIKNKIGQFTANPLIRNIIGQPKSSFDLRRIMDEQKIIIMNLSKGLVGESNANLLGSMLTTRIYLAAMSRADLPQEKLREMSNFYFYVDEFQSFANATFADILSEARKYKLNLTIAHQYIEQMEEEVRNAVFGNVGTIAAFRVGPFDAEVLETIFAPQFMAIDICNLGFAQIYLTLMIDGVGSPPFSAVTLPPLAMPSISCRDIIINSSRVHYARPRAEVEKEIIGWHELKHESEKQQPAEGSGGGAKEKGRAPERRDGNKDNTRDNSRGSGRERQQGGQKSGGRDERPQRKEEDKNKKLDDLRSVLANISKKDEPDKSADKKPSRRDNEKQEQNPQKQREPQKKPENKQQGNGQKQNEHPQQNDANLKQALADALKKQGADAPRRQQAPQQKPAPTPQEKELAPQQSAEPEPEQQHAPTPSHQPAENSTQSDEPQQQLQQEATPSEGPRQQEKDPLDPKQLERMLRVTTSDKSPLK